MRSSVAFLCLFALFANLCFAVQLKGANFVKQYPVSHELTDANFDETVTRSLQNGSTKHWVVEFYASWCGACAQTAPKLAAFDSLASATDDIRVGRIDVDQNTLISNRFFVVRLPTVYHIHGPDLGVRDIDRQRVEEPSELLKWIVKDRWKIQPPSHSYLLSPFGHLARVISYVGHFGESINRRVGDCIAKVTGERDPETLAKQSVLSLCVILAFMFLATITVAFRPSDTSASRSDIEKKD